MIDLKLYFKQIIRYFAVEFFSIFWVFSSIFFLFQVDLAGYPCVQGEEISEQHHSGVLVLIIVSLMGGNSVVEQWARYPEVAGSISAHFQRFINFQISWVSELTMIVSITGWIGNSRFLYFLVLIKMQFLECHGKN